MPLEQVQYTVGEARASLFAPSSEDADGAMIRALELGYYPRTGEAFDRVVAEMGGLGVFAPYELGANHVKTATGPLSEFAVIVYVPDEVDGLQLRVRSREAHGEGLSARG